MSGARVFVRLYDGASLREGEAELLMLPPPPLTWAGVVGAMITAVTKHDLRAPPDELAIKQARLFLLPTDAQGIVAELNARALRFGVRDNDQFAICLYGEEYLKPATVHDGLGEPTASGVHEENTAVAALTNMAGTAYPHTTTTTRLNDYSSQTYTTEMVYTEASAAPPSGGPPRGTMMGMGGNRKTTKRYRSISGKMAAIKSLGDQGLITAEDRGHLKDLLLNNDSPALQEALENYQNTGDFQAVKELLTKELRNPSAKRPTGDWLPESLINELSENFQTHDDQDELDSSSQYGGNYASAESPATATQNPFMYSSNHNDQSTASMGMHQTSASPSDGSDYTAVAEGDAVHPMNTHAYGGEDPSQSSWNSMQANGGGVYAQASSMGMQASPSAMYSGTPQAQINLPMRNRNGMNMMLKSPMQQQQTMMHGNPVEIGYTTASYSMAHQQGYAPMGYMPATAADYSRMGMNAYYSTPMQGQMAYSPYQQQQTAMAYGMSPYGQPTYGMQGYDYYGGGGYGYMKAGQMGGRMSGGKWTTAPPMPAYPPACSPEEKKEKIARWLKKRENRNWSNKPSYPVRHNIAKNRKRGEDGRFITKKRLAEMEQEEAARIAAGLPPSSGGSGGDGHGYDPEFDHDEGSGSDLENSTMPLGMLEPNSFAGLPAPVHT